MKLGIRSLLSTTHQQHLKKGPLYQTPTPIRLEIPSFMHLKSIFDEPYQIILPTDSLYSLYSSRTAHHGTAASFLILPTASSIDSSMHSFTDSASLSYIHSLTRNALIQFDTGASLLWSAVESFFPGSTCHFALFPLSISWHYPGRCLSLLLSLGLCTRFACVCLSLLLAFRSLPWHPAVGTLFPCVLK